MKRNINLVVLSFEVAAIVILHAVKISQAAPAQDLTIGVSKVKTTAPFVKHYSLLSIK